MRPPAVEKMGYYPTHEEIAQRIVTYIAPHEEGSRLLDPCCGEGTAASILGNALNCETWGVELSYKRFELASRVLNKVYQGPMESTYVSPESIPLMFLNPPYETDTIDHKGRLEIVFLKRYTTAITRGGLLVYIIPQRILSNDELAHHLASNYENVTIGKYQNSAYGQVIILANRRQYRINPAKEEIEKIKSWTLQEIPELTPVDKPIYSLLPAPHKWCNKPVEFIRTDWEDSEVVDATVKNGAMNSKEWTDLITPHPSGKGIMAPAMPLKKGHIAMLMASGMMGVMRLKDQSGVPLLVKGRVIKAQDETETRNDDGGITTIIKDRFVTTVSVIQGNTLKVIDDVDGLTKFMKEQGEQIAQFVLSKYQPLYNFDPTPQEEMAINRLGLNRKPIPGQNPGLLPAQKHAAIALCRVARYEPANVQGEMGVGKTTIAIAAMDLLDAYPAIVVCPPHLVEKWIREIIETVPGANAREIRRIGKSAGKEEVNDVDQFLEDVKAGKMGSKAVAVVANTSAKMGTGWRPAILHRKVFDKDSNQFIEVCCCPRCGTPITDDNGIYLEETDLENARLFCKGIVLDRQLDENGRREHDENGDLVWGKRICNNPLFVFDKDRRYSIAEYIKRKRKGEFKLVIGDEVHQFKGKASDRGVAFHQLLRATRMAITLTGTLFGGRSTSIFWLLHRLNHDVRTEFGFSDEMRWARLYGVLETTKQGKSDDTDDGYGVYTGHRRYRDKVKEQPGVSPALVLRLLPNTIFLTLNDLGVDLPSYQEQVVSLEMTNLQSDQYNKMDSVLKGLAREDNRYLSCWLQNGLARPNSGFRDEEVTISSKGNEHSILQLPAVNDKELLPKEKWLLDFCKEERRKRRKVLVYLRQTGTRDIRDHIRETLEKGGLRVTVLGSSIDPRIREDWIAQKTPYTDVLVCNPKLVETGLDLIDYATVVFAETEYSLYTMWQAIRRVWRLGQTQPVKAIFCVYSSSLEGSALALMGKKMKAAQLLYGDEVGGAIVPTDDGDFLTQLARDVLSNNKLPDLSSLFATEASHVKMADVWGNMPSKDLIVPVENPNATETTWEDWMKQHGLNHSPTKRKHNSQPPDQSQGSLF
jgi:superfamily II DNA or RNA helicase